MIGHLLWKGTKAVATGNAQAQLGIQSPHLPNMAVRLGRFGLVTSGLWISAVYYSGYVNMRTQPGSGPKLVLPGAKVISGPNRPAPGAGWASAGGGGGGGTAAPGGAQGGLPGAQPGGTKAGGFLPSNAKYTPGRADQGRDGQTNPGGPIIAPGAGYVLHIGSDPPGFGPDYPIVKFSSGPYAGRTIYIGHTHSKLRLGERFAANAILSYTGTQPVGNATVPGWFEIGFADSGYPGPMGQRTPF